MEGVVHIFRSMGLYSGTHAKWSGQFSKIIRHLKKSPLRGTPQATTSHVHNLDVLLTQLEPYLSKPMFTNSKPEEMTKAKDDLLQLWDFLLKFVVKTDSTSLQTKAFELIVAIMQRKEFSLAGKGFDSKEERPKISDGDMKVIIGYQRLLVDTFIVLMESVGLRQENFVQTIRFCATVLAILFFRLPMVGARIVESLKRKKERIGDTNAAFEKHKRKSIVHLTKARERLAGLKRMLLEKTPGIDDYSSVSSNSPVINPLVPELDQTQIPMHPLFLSDSAIDLNHYRHNSFHNLKNRIPENTVNVTVNESSEMLKQDHASVQIKRKKQSLKRRLLRLTSKDVQTQSFTAICKESDVHYNFIEKNPDLFRWSHFSDTSHIRRLEAYLDSHPCGCLKWVDEKESFFITFFKAFVTHVTKVSEGTIDWTLVSSYDLLLDCFWPLVKSYLIWYGPADMQPERAVGFIKSSSAASYVEEAYKLLIRTNALLLNDFIYLTYCETNVLSSNSVETSLNHIKSFFIAAKDSCYFGEALNVQTYWFGLKSFFDQELVVILKSVMVHLYEILPILNAKTRQMLVGNILRDFFFKMFLHWNLEIRLLFQSLMVFKFTKTERKKLPCATDQTLSQCFIKSSPGKGLICAPAGRSRGESKESTEEGDSNGPHRIRFNFGHHHSLSDDYMADVAVCSKMDYYISQCIKGGPEIPRHSQGFVEDALKTYTTLLDKCYSGETANTPAQLSRTLLNLLESRMELEKKISAKKID